MDKKLERKLIKLCDEWVKEANRMREWSNKNADLCGHSESAESLGDEGWHKLHRYSGSIDALIACTGGLIDVVREYQDAKSKTK
jgi:hypothetical protein